MDTNGRDAAAEIGFSITHYIVNRFTAAKVLNSRLYSCEFVSIRGSTETFTPRLITVYRTQSRFRATRLVVFHNLSEFSEAQGHAALAERLLCFRTRNDCYEILHRPG